MHGPNVPRQTGNTRSSKRTVGALVLTGTVQPPVRAMVGCRSRRARNEDTRVVAEALRAAAQSLHLPVGPCFVPLDTAFVLRTKGSNTTPMGLTSSFVVCVLCRFTLAGDVVVQPMFALPHSRALTLSSRSCCGCCLPACCACRCAGRASARQATEHRPSQKNSHVVGIACPIKLRLSRRTAAPIAVTVASSNPSRASVHNALPHPS